MNMKKTLRAVLVASTLAALLSTSAYACFDSGYRSTFLSSRDWFTPKSIAAKSISGCIPCEKDIPEEVIPEEEDVIPEDGNIPEDGSSTGEYITDEVFRVHCISAWDDTEFYCDELTAKGGTALSITAPEFDNWALVGDDTIEATIAPTHTYSRTDFAVLGDSWFRITPCYKLEWNHEGLQRNAVVAKKGNQYVIWTKEKLNEQEKVAIYESFSSQVNGMFGAKYKNCQFMYANGSTLRGVTINDDYISFDAHATWSMYAVGTYIPSSLEISQTECDCNDFYFWYSPLGGIED